MTSRITPRRTLLTGAGLALVGGLIIALSTDAMMWVNQVTGNRVDAGIYVVSIVASVLRLVALPLGIGLICTSIAMGYFDVRTSKTTEIKLDGAPE